MCERCRNHTGCIFIQAGHSDRLVDIGQVTCFWVGTEQDGVCACSWPIGWQFSILRPARCRVLDRDARQLLAFLSRLAVVALIALLSARRIRARLPSGARSLIVADVSSFATP
jgi:hypothetical protein